MTEIDVARSMTATADAGEADLGDLPEWNLDDLYAGMDDPALKRDLALAEQRIGRLRGTLQGQARCAGAAVGRSARRGGHRIRALEELLGRIVSFAGLLHAGDTSDPARSKFYGDVQEKITAASSHLLFFALELNRIDDDVLEKAMADPALGHYRPWLEDVRKEKPYQLEDRVELLFHEKSVTGRGAWNRLFDETMTSLRFDVGGKELAIEPTLNLLQDSDGAKRKAAAEALAVTFKANLRLFTHITNTLAKDKEISDRWRGFKDVADSRHLSNRVEPEVVDALVEAVRGAYPRLSHRYYKLKARWFGRDQLDHWDRNAPLPDRPTQMIPFGEARATVLRAYGAVRARDGGDRATLLRRALDRRAGQAGQGAGRLRASDGAVGAPLRAAQLSGQGARRDDARPRARPRRPSGAGRAAGRADGATRR